MIIDPRKIVINRRDLRNRSDGLVSAGLLLAFWGLMLYLARPLAASTGWSAVGHGSMAGSQLAVLPEMLARYLPIIAGLSLGLMGWSWYNRLRFSGSKDKRRVEQPDLPLADISSICSFGAREVSLIRRTEVLFFFFDDKGEVIAVKCREAAADTDYILAQVTALAPRVAAGLDHGKISETCGKQTTVKQPETSETGRKPAVPLARPLRPVPPGMEGRLISGVRPNSSGKAGGAESRRPYVPGEMIRRKSPGGLSPQL